MPVFLQAHLCERPFFVTDTSKAFAFICFLLDFSGVVFTYAGIDSFNEANCGGELAIARGIVCTNSKSPTAKSGCLAIPATQIHETGHLDWNLK
jgi:hypothetical protein